MCIRNNMYKHTYVVMVLSSEERFDVIYNRHYTGFLHDNVETYDCYGRIYFNVHNTMYILKSIYTRKL